MRLEPAEIVVAPGTTVTAMLKVERNGHDDLVTFSVDNLPHGVIVDNIGLSGVLMPKGENERQIFITADSWVDETTRPAFAIESQAGGQCSPPVTVRVRRGAPWPARPIEATVCSRASPGRQRWSRRPRLTRRLPASILSVVESGSRSPGGRANVKDFEFQAATTVDEAVSLLAARGPKAKVLAGGTDLIVQLREGMREADLVLDVKKIPELMEYCLHGRRGLQLGAGTPCYRVYRDREIAKAYPALADSARIIGGWQIQSRARIGGNLCNSSPAADSIPSLIALDAVCQSPGPHGRRKVPVAEFCTAPARTCWPSR